MKLDARLFVVGFLGLAAAGAVRAETPGCLPCAGVEVREPEAVAGLLAGSLGEEEVLYVKWRASMDASDAAAAEAIRDAGARPWIVFEFDSPRPLLDHEESLDAELRALAELARSVGEGAHFQLAWRSGPSAQADEYGYLIKRAAVAVSGAQPDALVTLALTNAETGYLQSLFAEEVAAYLDGIALPPAEDDSLALAATTLQTLDPGILVVADARPFPASGPEVLAEAGRLAESGAGVVFFDLGEAEPAEIAPFRILAREFAGDLSLDPYSVPSGAAGAWSFVRGEDLGLRVVVRSEPDSSALLLRFPDPQLHRPALVDLESGESVELYGLRTGSGFEVEVESPPEVMLLKLERMTAAELEGIAGLEEEVTVEDTRQMPVEEILRRLQAFEDAQSRRLRHYQAVNTAHLRFQGGTGTQTVETTFRGPYFVRQGESFDWAWNEFLVNGVKWRSRKIPEIPLLQPERAASLPIEITFTRDYRYRLRGTETVEGRDCWVVEFEPAQTTEGTGKLFRGTVWVDRQLYARVRTRAVQLGLSGDVVSNEETITFTPLDRAGELAPWSPASFFLPVRLVGQQIWSILNAAVVVEREIVLSEIRINADDFEQNRQAVLESDLTMLRDTEAGTRYLVVDDETGERVVQEKLDTSRRFLVGGILYDESQDFPIPLAGMNWLYLDWRGTGTQANVFFAGPLVSVGITDPSLGGSKFDLGFDVFALAIEGTDTLYRDGREVNEEDIDTLSPSLDLKIGRPFGNFSKLEFEYELEWRRFSESDDTASDFVIPSDHFNHGFSLTARYNRRGYKARLGGTYNIRSEWEPWGFPGNTDFDPDNDTYVRWGAGIGKIWHLPDFFKFGAEIEYLSGSRLDRFSKYEFGVFSDVTVHGYQSDKVKAEDVLAAHLTYGFDVGQLFRIDLVGDAALASDEATGLDDELLGGIGVVGTFVGPWRTIVNMDVGVALTGPDSGYSVFVTVLKLFNR